MNAIIGFSELLEAGIPNKLTAKQSEYVADIRSSGLHLMSILSDILDVSKIESEATELREENVDVAAEAQLCLRIVRDRAKLAGVELSAHIPITLPRLRADSRMVRQIMLNLMSNAVKFTPQGGAAKNFGLDRRIRRRHDRCYRHRYWHEPHRHPKGLGEIRPDRRRLGAPVRRYRIGVAAGQIANGTPWRFAEDYQPTEHRHHRAGAFPSRTNRGGCCRLTHVPWGPWPGRRIGARPCPAGLGFGPRTP